MPTLEERVGALERQYSAHEATCTERYGTIKGDVSELKNLARTTLVTICAACIAAIIYLLRTKLGL